MRPIAGGRGNAARLDLLRGQTVPPLSARDQATILQGLDPAAVAERQRLDREAKVRQQNEQRAREIERLNAEQAWEEARAGEWRNRPRVARSADGTEIPTDDIQIERMAGAGSVAYKHPIQYTVADRQMLADGCYAPDPAGFIDDNDTGYQSTLFMPDASREECADVRPVLATRGTEGMPVTMEGMKDWGADLASGGVGRDAYAPNHMRARRLLERARRESGHKAVSAGHSLGGATAQLTAAHNPDLVDRVLTFSSPGITEEDARFFDQESRGEIPVTHYGGDIDFIPEVGERALSGRVMEVDRPLPDASFLSRPVADHTTPLLQSLDETTVKEEPSHWCEDNPLVEAGRQKLGHEILGRVELAKTVLGLEDERTWTVERQDQIDARMREARHKEVKDSELPEGARSAADVAEAERIMREKGGPKEGRSVEILHP